MNFAKWVFRISGVLGSLQIIPLFFNEKQIGIDMPPAITHPEYFYGMLTVALAWQVVYLLISTDPLRYRPLMLLGAILGKGAYTIVTLALFALGRIPTLILLFGLLDLLYGVFFVAAYWATRPQVTSSATESVTSSRWAGAKF